jgi:hypothetical protein
MARVRWSRPSCGVGSRLQQQQRRREREQIRRRFSSPHDRIHNRPNARIIAYYMPRPHARSRRTVHRCCRRRPAIATIRSRLSSRPDSTRLAPPCARRSSARALQADATRTYVPYGRAHDVHSTAVDRTRGLATNRIDSQRLLKWLTRLSSN